MRRMIGCGGVRVNPANSGWREKLPGPESATHGGTDFAFRPRAPFFPMAPPCVNETKVVVGGFVGPAG